MWHKRFLCPSMPLLLSFVAASTAHLYRLHRTTAQSHPTRRWALALPAAFAINGAMYLNRPASLLMHKSFAPEGALGYVMPPERSIDIDTPWDLHVAELILQSRVVR